MTEIIYIDHDLTEAIGRYKGETPPQIGARVVVETTAGEMRGYRVRDVVHHVRAVWPDDTLAVTRITVWLHEREDT